MSSPRPIRSWLLPTPLHRATLLPLLFVAALLSPPAAAGEWFGEKPQAHGFLRSSLYFRTPDFDTTPTANQLRTELSLETDLQIYSSDAWSWSFHAITMPTYEAAYELQPDLYGRKVDAAGFGTGAPYPANLTATRSGTGRSFPADGGRLGGEFTILNADTGSSYSGELAPAIAIDDVPFFGRVTSPVATRGPNQSALGGNATGVTYAAFRDNFGSLLEPALGYPTGTFRNGGLPAGQGLDASLGLASRGLSTPLNSYAGSRGKRNTFEHSSFDVNRHENELKFECFDNAHPTCMFREFYFDVEYKDTFLRVGRQQIVWGKMDYFQLQDVINPIDWSLHNLFADLDERRIPQLAADLVHSLGRWGPLEDVSLEAAWVFDRFMPDQFGQCGEPWAFTVACQVRADAAAHQLLNISVARAQTHRWSIAHSQPAARVEFRLPKPAMSFSLSAFWGFQKRPVTRFSNHYSTENPNAAAMLFLQGSADPQRITGSNPNGSIAKLIDELSRTSQSFSPPHPHSGGAGDGVWITGFDPYDRSGPAPNPGGTLEAANRDLQNAWYLANNVATPALGGCSGVPDEPGGLAECGAEISTLGLPWAGSEAELEYPRVLSLGASMDYEIPKTKAVLRVEMAADIDRAIQNTDFRDLDGVSESSVFKLAIGLDRSVRIPFINPKRAAFVSLQTFLEHIVDYDDGSVGGDGMVPSETNVISTLFIQNYWRDDTITLTNRVAVDWNSGALIWGPKLRWAYDQKLSFELGVNLLWGRTKRHNIRDLCSDGSLLGSPTGCSFRDPTTWQAGNWQVMNAPLRRTAQSPFGFARQSFGDSFMRNRDEFFITATRRF